MSALPPEAIAHSPAEINASIRYSGYFVYRRRHDAVAPQEGSVAHFESVLSQIAADGVTIRGLYDLTGLRADADLMLWMLADSVDKLQAAVREVRRTTVGRCLEPTWSAIGLHRPAEFNKGHVPVAYATEVTKRWMTVYPFVRSYDWYLLPEAERGAILREHGMMGHEYPNVLATTISAFSLTDYEWLVTLEADEPYELTDVMRHLRGAKARLYVRVDTPFYTGRKIEPAEVAQVLA